MSYKQIISVILLTFLAFLAFGHIENFTFGLMDNAPMLALMLMGLDPDGWLGEKLARFKISPAFLACGVAMFVNTFTDGLAASLDVNAAFFGVVLGCLVPIAFLPIIWKFRNPSIVEDVEDVDLEAAYNESQRMLEIVSRQSKGWSDWALEMVIENDKLRDFLGLCNQCDGSGSVQGFDSYVACGCSADTPTCIHCDSLADGIDGKCMFHSEEDLAAR